MRNPEKDGTARCPKSNAFRRQLSQNRGGEVIERPASVVKELVENSVDSGAKRIDVTVTKGGTELIRVVDDGCGITPEDLELAVASHATSKIRDADDLFAIASFGFRGEALASIAEISHFRIRSRTADTPEGAEISVIGGEAEAVEPCGCRPGTEIEVRNLFFNTPVRRKFMRTTNTEMGHLSEALTRIALPHPEVHFTLTHNDRLVTELPPCSDVQQRIASLFGRDLSEALLWVEAEEGPIRLHGYVANPMHDRSNNKMQYLFLNGRYIRDRALGHALGEAYRGLLMTGRYAICFLNIDLPADQVDVNVHPTKTEVRFVDGGRLYSHLLGTIRSKFLSSDLTAHAKLNRTSEEQPTAEPAAEFSPEQRRMALDFSTPPSASPGASSSAPAYSAGSHAPAFGGDAMRQPRGRVPDFQPFPGGAHAHSAAATDFHPSPHPQSEPYSNPVAAPATIARSDEGTPAMQVYNRYLITESDEGVIVIDQHALHERILYEELREKVLARDLEVQKLLVPEPVQLTSAECEHVVQHTELLQTLGVEVDRINNTTILVLSYPAMLSNLAPAEMLRQIAAKLAEVPADSKEAPVDSRDVVDELLHMISCKAAIKAGDPLTGEEISALLRRRSAVQDAHHCPHGRPTTLVFSREELDRRFKRV